MAKPKYIELSDGTQFPIVFEDRSIIAIDKPVDWMLVPYNWNKTDRNLHLAIDSSIRADDFWARSRNLTFLRHVHRLDADTTGVLLFARSPGALQTFSRLFESRQVEKRYLVVVEGKPAQAEWLCRHKLGPDASQIGLIKVDRKNGKEAETMFRVLRSNARHTLLEAFPYTGRTHQIRVHLAADGHPVVGDPLYGNPPLSTVLEPQFSLALRAVELKYRDPFTRRPVLIRAREDAFLKHFRFFVESAAKPPAPKEAAPPQPPTPPAKPAK